MTNDPAPDPAAPARPPLAVRRYRLTLAYDGTLFHGWQKQEPPGLPPLRTVAGVVEGVLRQVMQQPINLVGASRTDAGVHARGQVAQFDAATPIPIERMAEAITARLPEDVDILDAQVAAPDFDCIKQVRSKQYRYRLFNTSRRPLEQRHHVYHCWTPLDPARMADAATRLVGRHDFAAFAAAKHNRQTTVRTIHECRVEVKAPEVHIVVSGDGFLYNMVRIIAGTLVEVGRGHFAPDAVDAALATGDRRLAGPTLPASGLWLEWVRYAPADGV